MAISYERTRSKQKDQQGRATLEAQNGGNGHKVAVDVHSRAKAKLTLGTGAMDPFGAAQAHGAAQVEGNLHLWVTGAGPLGEQVVYQGIAVRDVGAIYTSPNVEHEPYSVQPPATPKPRNWTGDWQQGTKLD